MTEKLSNYTSQEGTLYPQMWCGTQKGPAKSPEQPLSFGCLTPSPVFFFCTHLQFCSLYFAFWKCQLCRLPLSRRHLQEPISKVASFIYWHLFHMPKVSIYKLKFPLYLDYLLLNHKAKVIHLLHSTIKETLKNKECVTM